MANEEKSDVPRISINSQIRGLELRRPSVQQAVNTGLPFVRRMDLGYTALRHLCRTVEPYLPYAEVLTVKFTTSAGSQVGIDLGVVVIEPHTHIKFEVSHFSLIGSVSEAKSGELVFTLQHDLEVALVELANQVARTLATVIRDRSSRIEGIVFELGRFHAHAAGLSVYQIEFHK